MKDTTILIVGAAGFGLLMFLSMTGNAKRSKDDLRYGPINSRRSDRGGGLSSRAKG